MSAITPVLSLYRACGVAVAVAVAVENARLIFEDVIQDGIKFSSCQR